MGYNPETKIDKHLEQVRYHINESIEEVQKALKSGDLSGYKETFVEKLEDVLIRLFKIKRDLK
jgi:hypothetical protein